ncbi:helix-turn-helix domain-containing protein [Paenibacillus arenilitoris]|uniref:Helix-turn-helix transcriptional regulator n=1 Tax=Paenibacillus arenilitoris TaxID=2772299 RepID=A0A927CTY3_9BACL|nr:helix-turn-helix transcriptional regulator [Paenibacillus arenilitoris]MBD2872181.1 helix-turn-helix transcriptional regulator [Paenibacillus arenilitoris]
MKVTIGRCLLAERLAERGMSREKLAADLRMRPERIGDYIDNKRIMPLKTAVAIARTIGCNTEELYEFE